MSNLDLFRKKTKKWLDENCPKSMRSGADPKIPIDEVWGGRNAVYKNPESKILYCPSSTGGKINLFKCCSV